MYQYNSLTKKRNIRETQLSQKQGEKQAPQSYNLYF